MSTVLSASAPTSFEIKSAQLPLVALLLKSADLDRLGEEMKQRYGDIPDFFDHDPLLVDLSSLQAGEAADSPVDFAALVTLLRQFRLEPVAVRGGNDTQTAAAELAGLMPANDATVQRSAAASTPAPQAQVRAEAAVQAQPASAPVAATPAQGALVIDKPLRSGQQVYARGRDLVVMAMVNPGAEVIADGHIHVYAPLRGKAIAGARGNADARIFAMSMDPELISIAGIYRTSDNPLPADVLGKPAQVRLVSGPDGDKLVIDPLNP
jgi:septum site-determining protein MinC